MNYLIELTEEELKYICSVVPCQDAIRYFCRYPKEFTKIKPGFRAKSLSQEAVEKILFGFRNRDFIASFLQQHIDCWNKEINEEIAKDLENGLSVEAAYIDVLSESYFAENIPLFFKINKIVKGEDYLNVMSSAVLFQRENKKRVDFNQESLKKMNSSLEDDNRKLRSKLSDEEKKTEKLRDTEISLQSGIKEREEHLKHAQDKIREYSAKVDELEEQLEKTREEGIWKAEEMGQKIESLSGKLETLKYKISEDDSVLADYKLKLAAAEEEIDAWKNQVRTRDIQIFDYKAERATLITEREADREKIKSLKDALEKEAERIDEDNNSKLSRLSIVKDYPSSLCPEDMEEFEELLANNLDSLGLTFDEDGTRQFVDYLGKRVFTGVPIIMKRGPGINIANCLANTLYGVPMAAILSYSDGSGVKEIIEYLQATPDRVICIDGFIGNCNEQELIPALKQYCHKIIILTYMFDRTMRYVPNEILSYAHYISADSFDSIIRIKNITEEPSEITEKPVDYQREVSTDRRAQKILKEIACECGFSSDIAGAMADGIESEEEMNEVLMFSLLPYVSYVFGKNPYNCSKRLQRYAGEAGRCSQREIILRWFG